MVPTHDGRQSPSMVLRGVSLTVTDLPTGDGPFCYGQIIWDNGPLSSRTVRRC